MEVTAGLAESNSSLLPGLWRDSLHVICELTACTPGSAPGPMLGNAYGKTLPFYLAVIAIFESSHTTIFVLHHMKKVLGVKLQLHIFQHLLTSLTA